MVAKKTAAKKPAPRKEAPVVEETPVKKYGTPNAMGEKATLRDRRG